MRPWILVAAAVLLLGSALGAGFAGAAAGAPAGPVLAASSPVVGNLSGPTVVSTNTNQTFFINGTGGPAVSSGGTLVGNLTWLATIGGTNTTGVAVTPASGNLTPGTPSTTTVSVGTVVQTLTLTVEVSSTNASANVSANFSWVFHVVEPYTLTLHLETGKSAAVAAFNLTIFLDGTPVGSLAIPNLSPSENYTATFEYPTLGLSQGEHTFTASLAQEHGLVTFAGGATSISVQFFVPGAPPSYTVWYVAGIVSFFGVLFIFATRVAARRRSPARK